MTAIVLAGGFGKRLREVVHDVPKPMAPVNGRPFLEIVLDYLIREKITLVVLSVGHKYEFIQEHFKNNYRGLVISYSVETEALGTGGAIFKAMKGCDEREIYVLNGDSYFDISLSDLRAFHIAKRSDFTVALKELKHFDRYGTVKIDTHKRIINFEEKKSVEVGYINGGVYCVNRNIFETQAWPEIFSIEKDLLEKNFQLMNFYGLPFKDFFIDIGIPEDYDRAQIEFKKP